MFILVFCDEILVSAGWHFIEWKSPLIKKKKLVFEKIVGEVGAKEGICSVVLFLPREKNSCITRLISLKGCKPTMTIA